MRKIDRESMTERDKFHYDGGFHDGFIKGSQHSTKLLIKMQQSQPNVTIKITKEELDKFILKEKKI